MPGAGATAILVVEDNEADADLVVDAFREVSPHVAVRVVDDGSAALDYLRSGGDSDERRPDLVLLDLNMPGPGGLSVLADIKADDRLRSIPVLILTTSKSPQEIRRSYELGAAAVLNKPMRLAQYREMLEAVERFWLGHVRYSREYV